jgi:SPP1 gp7 family putative phage head morphogenesis protein
MPSVVEQRNPFKIDPSRTAGLRRRFAADMLRRLEELRTAVVRLVKDEDVFGLKDSMAFNTRWKYIPKDQKVAAFRRWLEEQVEAKFMTKDRSGQLWTERYIRAAYEQGRIRGNTQAAKLRRRQYESFQLQYTKEQRRKVELLLQESHEDIKGFTTRMSTRAGRIVSDSFTKGESPDKLAKRLSKAFGIEISRAKAIAQTSLVRAQAEGQLDSYEDNDVREIWAEVEWTTAGDSKVCPECKSMDGSVFTIREARGLIPKHVNCRCAWTPVPPKTRSTGRGRRP